MYSRTASGKILNTLAWATKNDPEQAAKVVQAVHYRD
jgi:hypothetical protein